MHRVLANLVLVVVTLEVGRLCVATASFSSSSSSWFEEALKRAAISRIVEKNSRDAFAVEESVASRSRRREDRDVRMLLDDLEPREGEFEPVTADKWQRTLSQADDGRVETNQRTATLTRARCHSTCLSLRDTRKPGDVIASVVARPRCTHPRETTRQVMLVAIFGRVADTLHGRCVR